MKVTIKLELHNQPERFEVSDPLANLLGIRTGTRAQVLSALWVYIRQRNLLVRHLLKYHGDFRILKIRVERDTYAHTYTHTHTHIERERERVTLVPATYGFAIRVIIVVMPFYSPLGATQAIRLCSSFDHLDSPFST